MKTLDTLYTLWDSLSDVYVNDDMEIEQEFLDFGPGKNVEIIWHWFESQNDKFIVGDVQQGIRVQHVDLENVRHSNLGATIEDMQESINRLEVLYLYIREDDPDRAETLKNVLEAWDDVSAQYELVR